MARIDELRARLVKIDAAIDEAIDAGALSVSSTAGAHSLTRQRLEALQMIRNETAGAIQMIERGQPFGWIELVPEYRYGHRHGLY